MERNDGAQGQNYLDSYLQLHRMLKTTSNNFDITIEIGKIDNIKEDQYNLIKQEIKIKKEQIISNNKEIFKKI